MDLSDIKTGEWVVVFATLMGPILAVQAQKFLEGLREQQNAKRWVFRALMTTRKTRLSEEHVRALNMIDVSFYGTRVFLFHWQTPAEKRVLLAWKIYLDSLTEDLGLMTDAQQHFSWAERENKFVTLLERIAKSVGYDFDEVHIRKAGYIPIAHGDLEKKRQQALDGVIQVLNGTSHLKMDVVSFPVNPQVAASHQKMIEQIVSATEGGALKISGDAHTA